MLVVLFEYEAGERRPSRCSARRACRAHLTADDFSPTVLQRDDSRSGRLPVLLQRGWPRLLPVRGDRLVRAARRCSSRRSMPCSRPCRSRRLRATGGPRRRPRRRPATAVHRPRRPRPPAPPPTSATVSDRPRPRHERARGPVRDRERAARARRRVQGRRPCATPRTRCARSACRMRRSLVRAGGAAEVVIGVGALAVGGPVFAALVALSYLAFAGFVVVALRSGSPISSCGCFGKVDTPPSLVHVVIDLLRGRLPRSRSRSRATRSRSPTCSPTSRCSASRSSSSRSTGIYLVFLSFTALPKTLAAARVVREARG